MSPGTDDLQVRAFRTRFDDLKRAADKCGDAAIIAEKRRKPVLYWHSRMTEASLGKLVALYQAAYACEIQRVLAELVTLDAELARLCPEWTLHTEAELCEPPSNTKGRIS